MTEYTKMIAIEKSPVLDWEIIMENIRKSTAKVQNSLTNSRSDFMVKTIANGIDAATVIAK